MEKILGLIDAPFTPFYENGEVNYEPIPAYAKMLAKNGLKGVFINGSSGEGYMLTEEERIKLTEAWVAAAPEGFKIIVHVGSTCVRSSRRMAEHAQRLGNSLISVVLAILCFGIGYGFFDTNNMPILCQFIPSRQRATAYGFINMAGVLGGAAITTLLGNLSLGFGFALLGGVTVLSLVIQLVALRPKTIDME